MTAYIYQTATRQLICCAPHAGLARTVDNSALLATYRMYVCHIVVGQQLR